MKIKTILKCIAWAISLVAIALLMVYGFWLTLIFILFDEPVWMWLAIAGEVFLAWLWWWIVNLAEC